MRLTRVQVTEFLTAVRALPPISEDPSELDSALAERAASTEQLVQRHFGISLTRDRSGVEALDQLPKREALRQRALDEVQKRKAAARARRGN